MLKKTGLLLLLTAFCCFAKARPVAIKTDDLVKILQLTDQKQRDRQLIAHIKSVFKFIPLTDMVKAKAAMHDVLIRYYRADAASAESFIESICQQRGGDLTGCENALIRSIVLAKKIPDHYLAYSLYSELGFFQTFRGNTIDAVANFGMANKEAITLNDADLQVVIDINISDIYYRNNFYSQSLFYLNHADSLVNKHLTAEPRLQNIVYFNKAEIYFRQGRTDSLRRYSALLNDKKAGPYKIYIYRQRTAYYLSILNGDYKTAISRITALQTDPQYRFDDDDRQFLAQAYTRGGMPDSAKSILNRLLADKAQNNHPEVKYHLYKLLGEAADKQNDYQQAALAYRLSLLQLEEQANRLTQVGNISSKMKIDELEGTFNIKEDALVRQRLALMFIVIISLLTIIIVAISYRGIKQKRFYEKLLFDAKKEELSFINSHEVRRHLANILGVIELIKHGEDKQQEYLLAEDHLLSAAESLDEAIKNISSKLDN